MCTLLIHSVTLRFTCFWLFLWNACVWSQCTELQITIHTQHSYMTRKTSTWALYKEMQLHKKVNVNIKNAIIFLGEFHDSTYIILPLYNKCHHKLWLKRWFRKRQKVIQSVSLSFFWVNLWETISILQKLNYETIQHSK